ncbi:MAG: hypothetical protein H6727_12520 [Myxococcales bacterium]|nr:hypothetical protein [Myxococcales bacterium]
MTTTPSQQPYSTCIPEESPKHPGLTNIEDMKRPHPWGMGLVGLIKWLAWQTDGILGKTKTSIAKQAIQTACTLLGADEKQTKQALDTFDTQYKKELVDSVPASRYANYANNLYVHPFEATRRLRYFSEDFLNKEFDIFFALLPAELIHAYLSQFFQVPTGGHWNVFGNSNDLEYSLDIQFMQIDTLAYHPQERVLAALELKVDADIGEQQIFKYAMLAAALEAQGRTYPDSQLKLLVIGTQEDPQGTQSQALRQTALSQLEQKLYPKRGLSKEDAERYHPRCKELLETMELHLTSWQSLGDFFQQKLPEIPQTGYSESCFKLVDGFLASLGQRYSRKLQRNLYIPS